MKKGERTLNKPLWGRTLVVAPHYDDESIGTGGTIALYTKQGGEVHIVVVFSGESGMHHEKAEDVQHIRKEEMLRAANILGIESFQNLSIADRCPISVADLAQKLIRVFRQIRPQAVIAPHLNERDPEHIVTAQAVREAAWLSATEVFPIFGKPCPMIKLLLGYEVWTPIDDPNFYIDITDVLETKLKAIEMHGTQIKNKDWVSAAKGLAIYRGVTSGCGKYAEAFKMYEISQDFFFSK